MNNCYVPFRDFGVTCIHVHVKWHEDDLKMQAIYILYKIIGESCEMMYLMENKRKMTNEIEVIFKIANCYFFLNIAGI